MRAPASGSRSVAISRAQWMGTLRLSAKWGQARRSLSRCRGERRLRATGEPPLSRDDFADIKVAELGVLRAHFVEAHVGNQFLEVDRILREERDTPFPGSQSDRTGNHLLDFSGIAAVRQAVSLH